MASSQTPSSLQKVFSVNSNIITIHCEQGGKLNVQDVLTHLRGIIFGRSTDFVIFPRQKTVLDEKFYGQKVLMIRARVHVSQFKQND